MPTILVLLSYKNTTEHTHIDSVIEIEKDIAVSISEYRPYCGRGSKHGVLGNTHHDGGPSVTGHETETLIRANSPPDEISNKKPKNHKPT